jgi:seryl-tRNA synthetase
MRTSAMITDDLRRSGQLWEPAPGLVALRGAAAQLRAAIAGELHDLCMEAAPEEWHVPPALPFHDLARAEYFASFPQWLTAAAHLDTDDDTLLSIADADDPSAAAECALRPVPIALQPAVCYHVYAALADSTPETPVRCTVAGTCWRHEAGRFAPLERGWAFTMREAVCVADADTVRAFRMRGLETALELARRLGLGGCVEAATDPFFAARGRAMLQQLKSLKHELRLSIGDGRNVAAASFNDHAQFFGNAYGIRLADGSAASSSCIAFGIERWVLAVLVEYGTDPTDWPLRVDASAGRRQTAGDVDVSAWRRRYA